MNRSREKGADEPLPLSLHLLVILVLFPNIIIIFKLVTSSFSVDHVPLLW